ELLAQHGVELAALQLRRERRLVRARAVRDVALVDDEPELFRLDLREALADEQVQVEVEELGVALAHAREQFRREHLAVPDAGEHGVALPRSGARCGEALLALDTDVERGRRAARAGVRRGR